jgi:hypothetical protein
VIDYLPIETMTPADQHDAWDGELIYPNVPVSINQSR